MKTLLVLGCQRSGTTLLTSMIGRHKDVNMLNESITHDIFKLIGKKYRGNKLVIPRQIRMKRRATRFGFLLNRISKMVKSRVTYPLSRLSLQDYIDVEAKIICIIRERKSTIDSMMRRSKFTEKQAAKEYDKAMEFIEEIKQKSHDLHVVKYEELLLNPENTMMSICNFLDIEYDKRMLEGYKYNYVYPRERLEVEKANE